MVAHSCDSEKLHNKNKNKISKNENKIEKSENRINKKTNYGPKLPWKKLKTKKKWKNKWKNTK